MARGHPALYQINTRVWLGELGQALGRPATLDDITEGSLDEFAAAGFDWVWLLGVWQTGEAGRQVSLHQPAWKREHRELLPDFTADDVCGSPFAVHDYVVHHDFGGPGALARLRKRLAERGLRLMLDFVPNHTGPDHRWVREHPEFYIAGSEADLGREPANYQRVDTLQGPRVMARGRDPYSPCWADTLQLNYRHHGLRAAMLHTLDTTAEQCDGVRCDMAMLVLPDVITRTWGDRARPADGTAPVDEPFWPGAIARVHGRHPGFLFLAEVYWDLEWALQQQGFDYTYDKRYYDRLRDQDAGAVRRHLQAAPEYQRRLARFLENHDEPRAAAVFPGAVHQAAAVLAFLVPGLRFLHEGQCVGRRQRAGNHLRRRTPEPVDRELESFYARLLACMGRPEVREGEWRLLDALPAWSGNATAERFVAFSWEAAGRRLVVAVNFGPTQGECFVKLCFEDLNGRGWRLRDVLNAGVNYERDGHDLAQHGLFLDIPAWAYHAFEMTPKA